MLAALREYPAADAATATAATANARTHASGDDARMSDPAARPVGPAASADGSRLTADVALSDMEDLRGGVSPLRLRSISAPGGSPSLAAAAAPSERRPDQQPELTDQTAAGAPGPWAPKAGELHLPIASWGLPADLELRAPRGLGPLDWRVAPELLVEEAGLCCWHRLDTSYGLPKVRLRSDLI